MIGWWGNGAPPWERWAGVSIPIEPSWNAKLARWETGAYYFDATAADNAVDFFPSCLTHHKGAFAGKPFYLEDWQAMLIIRPIFGWKHIATGLRRFRKVYIEVPKKNGKSQLCAGLGIYMTFCDGEPGAEVFCAAAERDQAAIIFDEAKASVEDCPELNDRAAIYKRSIVYEETRSSFKVLSADAKTKHGFNVHTLIFDELHAQPNRTLFETLEKGIAARLQPLIIMITTAGDDQESICYEQHEYAESVIKDGGDDSFLPVIFGLKRTEEQQWSDIAAIARVNPSFGVTIREEFFKNEINAAQKDARKQNAFKQLHCNIWTQQAKLWIPIERWDDCQREINLESLAGLPVAGGLDLSSKIDLSCFVLAFRHDDPPGTPPTEVLLDGDALRESEEASTEWVAQLAPKKLVKKFKINFSVTLVPFFWMPEESLTERKAKDRFAYDLMNAGGLIDLTEGNIIDYDVIYETIVNDLGNVYRLRDSEIGYDPWNATQLSTQLAKDGFSMIETPQTFRHLSEPSKIFEAMVLSGRVAHSGHAVLRWCVQNVAVKEDGSGNIKPVKPSAMKRIDGVVASVLAISRLILRNDNDGPTAMWVTRKDGDY